MERDGKVGPFLPVSGCCVVRSPPNFRKKNHVSVGLVMVLGFLVLRF